MTALDSRSMAMGLVGGAAALVLAAPLVFFILPGRFDPAGPTFPGVWALAALCVVGFGLGPAWAGRVAGRGSSTRWLATLRGSVAGAVASAAVIWCLMPVLVVVSIAPAGSLAYALPDTLPPADRLPELWDGMTLGVVAALGAPLMAWSGVPIGAVIGGAMGMASGARGPVKPRRPPHPLVPVVAFGSVAIAGPFAFFTLGPAMLHLRDSVMVAVDHARAAGSRLSLGPAADELVGLATLYVPVSLLGVVSLACAIAFCAALASLRRCPHGGAVLAWLAWLTVAVASLGAVVVFLFNPFGSIGVAGAAGLLTVLGAGPIVLLVTRRDDTSPSAVDLRGGDVLLAAAAWALLLLPLLGLPLDMGLAASFGPVVYIGTLTTGPPDPATLYEVMDGAFQAVAVTHLAMPLMSLGHMLINFGVLALVLRGLARVVGVRRRDSGARWPGLAICVLAGHVTAVGGALLLMQYFGS